MRKLLITGHLGLIGRHISPLLESKGYSLIGIDVKNNSGDICKTHVIEKAIEGCHGIIHLAAVSRVIWGEIDPEKCWLTNADSSEQIFKVAAQSPLKPWVLVSSSREVYGESQLIPVSESSPLEPVNLYGRSKLAMEHHALKARESGLNTAIVRLANVYGCIHDHSDRVLPAFCRNAVEGKPLRVDGFDNLFDFTHVSDTARGIIRLVELLEDNEQNLPPIHLLPGIGTSLLQAAQMAVASANSSSTIIKAPSRNYDVSHFIGDPSRAKSILDWKANITPEQGIAHLVSAFKSNTQMRIIA